MLATGLRRIGLTTPLYPCFKTNKAKSPGCTFKNYLYFGLFKSIIIFECQKQFVWYKSRWSIETWKEKVRIWFLTKVNVKGNYTRFFKCRRVCLLGQMEKHCIFSISVYQYFAISVWECGIRSAHGGWNRWKIYNHCITCIFVKKNCLVIFFLWQL